MGMFAISFLLTIFTALTIASIIRANNNTTPACIPKTRFCDDSDCYENATGTYICPSCCEDLICVISSGDLRCSRRPPTFGQLCRALAENMKTRFGHQPSTTSTSRLDDVSASPPTPDRVEVYTFSNVYKNCTVTARGAPDFRAACELMKETAFGQFTAYTVTYRLYNSTGGRCGWVMQT